MEKPPMEWIDRLFDCMEMFYAERWSHKYVKGRPKSLLMTLWQSGLTGCTYDEIKRALILYKRQAAECPTMFPPSHLEFFRTAKHSSQLYFFETKETKKGSLEVAQKALKDIRQKLYR